MSADPHTLADLFEHETLGAPENAVGFVLWRVVHRYVRAIDRALAPTGLTHLQFTVLAMAAWMARSGEPLTQVALARFGDIHPMQVSQMLKTLEGKGLVARPRSEADTRARRIEVTEGGVAALRRSMPLAIAVQVIPHPAMAVRFREQVTDLVSSLSDPEIRVEAAEVLRGLIDRVVLMPDPCAPDRHHLEVHGALASVLALGVDRVGPMGRAVSHRPGSEPRRLLASGSGVCGTQFSVVAGTGFEPVTFRL